MKAYDIHLFFKIFKCYLVGIFITYIILYIITKHIHGKPF